MPFWSRKQQQASPESNSDGQAPSFSVVIREFERELEITMQALAFAIQRNPNRDFQQLARSTGELIGKMLEAAHIDDTNVPAYQSEVDSRILRVTQDSHAQPNIRDLITEFYEEFVKVSWIARIEAQLTNDGRFRAKLLEVDAALNSMQAQAGRAGAVPDAISADFEQRLRSVAPALAVNFSRPFPG